MNDYPDSKDIERILTWDGTARELCEFVCALWSYPDRASFLPQTQDMWGEPETGHHILSLSTGGWSGNEEIIDALNETWFAYMFKAKWIHGGHYWYEIGDQLLDSTTPGFSWGKLEAVSAAVASDKKEEQ